MTTKRIYIAFDGTEFDNKDDCEDYENELENTPLMWDNCCRPVANINKNDFEFVYADSPCQVNLFNNSFSAPEMQIEEGLNFFATESVAPYGNRFIRLDEDDVKNIICVAKKLGWLDTSTCKGCIHHNDNTDDLCQVCSRLHDFEDKYEPYNKGKEIKK